MKKFLKISLLLIVFVTVNMGAIQAQKFGYLSSQAILAEMPDVKQMESNLKILQDQLQKKGQNMLAAYQTKEQNAVQKKERGELSPLEEENLLKDLQKEQDNILKFQQEMQEKMADKQSELLEPIYAKVNEAIKTVAKENGYQMIFEAGVLLYADETADVTAKVKSKLGL